MQKPVISVIVPVYNAERWLRRCVDSILGQTFTDFELLLIDDGSKDGSGAICDEYAARDSRIRVFHKPNGGVSSARNLGLGNARGEWITFVDADDYLLPQWSEVFKQDFVNTDIIIFGIQSENTSGVIKEYSYSFKGKPNIWVESPQSQHMQGALWNKYFRTDIIKKQDIRLDTRLKFREDEEFVLRYLTYCNRVVVFPVIGYHYFEPDWGAKYFEVSKNLETFDFVISRQCSFNKLGIKGYINNENLKELRYRLCYNSIKDPVRMPRYIWKTIKVFFQN